MNEIRSKEEVCLLSRVATGANQIRDVKCGTGSTNVNNQATQANCVTERNIYRQIRKHISSNVECPWPHADEQTL